MRSDAFAYKHFSFANDISSFWSYIGFWFSMCKILFIMGDRICASLQLGLSVFSSLFSTRQLAIWFWWLPPWVGCSPPSAQRGIPRLLSMGPLHYMALALAGPPLGCPAQCQDTVFVCRCLWNTCHCTASGWGGTMRFKNSWSFWPQCTWHMPWGPHACAGVLCSYKIRMDLTPHTFGADDLS